MTPGWRSADGEVRSVAVFTNDKAALGGWRAPLSWRNLLRYTRPSIVELRTRADHVVTVSVYSSFAVPLRELEFREQGLMEVILLSSEALLEYIPCSLRRMRVAQHDFR